MNEPLPEWVTYQLFEGARTHASWEPREVPESVVRRLYNMMKFGPTSHNCFPARFLFLCSEEAKQRLIPALNGSNVDKVKAAPLTVIIAYDLEFYEGLKELFPAFDAAKQYRDDPEKIQATALRNSSLQGAYLMLAARALGLDCGPMSGFNTEQADREFFPEGRWKSNFLCNLGYGIPERLPPAKGRPEFDSVCRVL